MTARRNLILLRGGDSSLHPSWLGASSAERNWDLHISYYGKQDHPYLAEGVTWSDERDSPNKWNGIAASIAKGLDLSKYDYVAMPDDDIIIGAADWNRAFDICREHSIPAAQISLDHRSFFGLDETLKRPGFTLRYTSIAELMPAIFRADFLNELMKYLPLPGNLWALDHVVANLLRHDPRGIAIIDEVSVLHTRAFWTGPVYAPAGGRERARDYHYAVEQEFLQQQGMTRVSMHQKGGLTRHGKFLPDVDWTKSLTVVARLRRQLRHRTKVIRIAYVEDGTVYSAFPVRGATNLRVDPSKALLKHAPEAI